MVPLTLIQKSTCHSSLSLSDLALIVAKRQDEDAWENKRMEKKMHP